MLQPAYNNPPQATYTRVEEPVGRSAGMGPPPPPPPPPPSALTSGGRTPILQPGCRSPTTPGKTVLSYSTGNAPYSTKPAMDPSTPQYGSSGVRPAPNDQQIRGHQPNLPHAGVGGPVVSSLKWRGSERSQPQQLASHTPGGQVPVGTVDTDLALSLVNETRPSYEMKTAGKQPLSEQHLLSLVDEDLISPRGDAQLHRPLASSTYRSPPQNQPILYQAISRKEQEIVSSGHSPVSSPYRPAASSQPSSGHSPMSSPYRPAASSQPMLQQAISHRENQLLSKPVHSPLTVETQYGRSLSPYGSSVSPQDFDPNSLCRELRETQLEARSPSRSPKKPSSSFSPRQLSAYRTAPPVGNDVDALTSRMMYQMETGLGAAGDYNCAKCGEGISSERPGCTALSETYHLDCFVCWSCGNKLAGGSFYSIDGKPYCEKDYVATLDKCTECNKPIMDRILRASGKAFHPQCFLCTACGKCLDGVPFTIDSNNHVHCVQCFHDKYAPRCAMCDKPIVPEEGKEDSLRIVAMDKSFHVDCYKCQDCGMKLSSKIEGHGCYPLDGQLFCKSCNAERVRKLTANA